MTASFASLQLLGTVVKQQVDVGETQSVLAPFKESRHCTYILHLGAFVYVNSCRRNEYV